MVRSQTFFPNEIDFYTTFTSIPTLNQSVFVTNVNYLLFQYIKILVFPKTLGPKSRG